MCGGRTPSEAQAVEAHWDGKQSEASKVIEQKKLEKERCLKETAEINARLEAAIDLTEQSKAVIDAAEKKAKAEFFKWTKEKGQQTNKSAPQEDKKPDELIKKCDRKNREHEVCIESMYAQHIKTLKKERDEHHIVELEEARAALQQRKGRLQEIERLIGVTEQARSDLALSIPPPLSPPKETDQWVGEARKYGLEVGHLMDMMIQTQSSHMTTMMFTEMTNHHIAVRDLTTEQIQDQQNLVQRLEERLVQVNQQISETEEHRDEHVKARRDVSWFPTTIRNAGGHL